MSTAPSPATSAAYPPESGGASESVAESWRQSLRNAFRNPRELLSAVGLEDHVDELICDQATDAFRFLVPREYAARMRFGDRCDPLLRQVLPVSEETHETPGFVSDPLRESEYTLTPGLLQKYAGRALMVTTGSCAIHCRYCFRRHFPYEQSPPSRSAWRASIDAIAADSSIHEVLLSGGDPLTLVDESLQWLIEQIDQVPHVRRLRIHSRLPVVIPSRVNSAFIEMLRQFSGAAYVVLHINHPAEIDASLTDAIAHLVDAGAVVLNQSVLMRSINDDAETLITLCEMLADRKVRPYYLHRMDAVAGAAHFVVDDKSALEIVSGLRDRLPGYAVPSYVAEIPGRGSKTPLA